MCDRTWVEAFFRAIQAAKQFELDMLAHTALRLGQDTAFAAEQASRGMDELMQAGSTIAEVLEGASRAIEISVEEFEAAEDDDD